LNTARTANGDRFRTIAQVTADYLGSTLERLREASSS
jgi:hypothetical protein